MSLARRSSEAEAGGAGGSLSRGRGLLLLRSPFLSRDSFLAVGVNHLRLFPAESPKEGKGNKASPLSVKGAKRKVESGKQATAGVPVNG